MAGIEEMLVKNRLYRAIRLQIHENYSVKLKMRFFTSQFQQPARHHDCGYRYSTEGAELNCCAVATGYFSRLQSNA